MKIDMECLAKAPDRNTCDKRTQRYVHPTGVRRAETKVLQRESDWSDSTFVRYSDDNGRTWGDWEDVHKNTHETIGEDEINTYHGTEQYNQVHNHFVSVGMQRIFFGGHKSAYRKMWRAGEPAFVDHVYLYVRKDGEQERDGMLVRYEPGALYDPTDHTNPEYAYKNRGYLGNAVDVMQNGDIWFAFTPPINVCCRLLGKDPDEVFPSCPNIMNGLMVARGVYNQNKGQYDLHFSRPVVISDLISSRGVCEPEVVKLDQGRLLAVFRGSNVISESWNTRIEPSTPGYKWFCISDDNGKTFTEPAPWHFDDREVIYSSSSYHRFIRSIKNQKLYWLGNVTSHHAYGNHPRYPLVIAEVNERGVLIKDTMTVVDDKRKDDSEKLQLSNFSILQDRETKNIEIYLSKLGQRAGYTWWADSVRYIVDPENE